MLCLQKIILVSGYFNPLHKGHIEYFEKARSIGDRLWVIVNSDLQRELKGSKYFQDENERLRIVQSLRVVDHAVLSIDRDRTVAQSIRFLAGNKKPWQKFLFANGGDQDNTTIPEAKVCQELGVELVDGLGKKIQSSSWLLKAQ